MTRGQAAQTSAPPSNAALQKQFSSNFFLTRAGSGASSMTVPWANLCRDLQCFCTSREGRRCENRGRDHSLATRRRYLQFKTSGERVKSVKCCSFRMFSAWVALLSSCFCRFSQGYFAIKTLFKQHDLLVSSKTSRALTGLTNSCKLLRL